MRDNCANRGEALALAEVAFDVQLLLPVLSREKHVHGQMLELARESAARSLDANCSSLDFALHLLGEDISVSDAQ